MGGPDLLTSVGLVVWIGAVMQHFKRERDMSIKTKSFKALGLLLVVFAMAGLAWAATDTYDAPVGAPGTVDGLPMCVFATGTTAGTPEDIAITIPDGFTPNYVLFLSNTTAAAGAPGMEWHRGMAQDSGFSLSAAGDPSYVSSNGISYSTTANTVTIAAETQSAGVAYITKICR